SGATQNAGRFEEQNEDEDRAGDSITIAREPGDASGDGFHQSDEQPAQYRSPKISDPADNRSNEGAQPWLNPHERLDGRSPQTIQDPRHSGEGGTETEGKRDDPVHI